MKKHSGYTLIELLLVVAVIALIAALGVKTYRDKAQSDRINLAALGMQHVLESAMAYNVANKGHWPTQNWNSNDCLISNVASDPFVQTYLPNQNYQSNFGTHYCWSGNDQNNEPTAPLFWVAMPVPATDAPEATDFAKRIAARLPNAIITDNPSVSSTGSNYCNNNPCYVKAAVAVPSLTTNNNGFLLVGMGYCMPQDPNNSNYVSDPLLGPHFPAIAGIPGGVQCTQLAGDFNGQKDEQRRAQYVVNFTCNNATDLPYVYITPNFLTTPRYNPNDGFHTLYGNNSSFLDRMQVQRFSNGSSPNIWENLPQANSTCTPIENLSTQFSCSFAMDATSYRVEGDPLNPSTNTPGYSVAHKGPGYAGQGSDKSPQNPGAVGATYVAACVVGTSPYAKLTLKQKMAY